MTSQQELIKILRDAYSGERAAAYAYRGHWKSLRDASERTRIRQIEDEEWQHRRDVGAMLAAMNSAPVRFKELKMLLIGRGIGFLCHVIGWFLPMYFAGRLEGGNVVEYETAAAWAAGAGLTHFESGLREMAAREKEHVVYFFSVIANHRLLPLMQSIFGCGDVGKVSFPLP